MPLPFFIVFVAGLVIGVSLTVIYLKLADRLLTIEQSNELLFEDLI